jgi:hypothetical protein
MSGHIAHSTNLRASVRNRGKLITFQLHWIRLQAIPDNAQAVC